MPEIKDSARPEAVVTIRNRKGLHARASAKFVKCAESYDAIITVTREGHQVGGTSIMGLMMLAAAPGTTIRISASGREAGAVIRALSDLVRRNFGEDE
jgi:phosphocarrier protein